MITLNKFLSSLFLLVLYARTHVSAQCDIQLVEDSGEAAVTLEALTETGEVSTQVIASVATVTDAGSNNCAGQYALSNADIGFSVDETTGELTYALTETAIQESVEITVTAVSGNR